MSVTTTAQIDPEVSVFFDGILLDRRKQFNVHLLGAQQRRLPSKNSDTLVLRRFDPLPLATSPLTEAVTPNSQANSKFDITIQLQQFGAVVELSDKVMLTVQDDTANETADQLQQNMNESHDAIVRDMLASSASQIDCLNGVNSGAITELNQTDIDLAIDFLEGNNGVKFSPDVPGQARDGTAPVWAAYWGIVHTDLRSDVKAVASFLGRAQYSEPTLALQPELGSTDEVRWLKSPAAHLLGVNYSNFIYAQNAYGASRIDELSASMILHGLGHGEDRLNQRQSMGWKSMFGVGILDDGWVVNLRATKG